jgi:O-antigen ligase
MKNQLIYRSSDFFYFLMMFFLPISLLLDNIFLGLLFLSLVLNSKKLINNNVIYYLLAFFLFTVINGFLNNFFLVEKENYIRLLPFLLIPFCLDNLENKIKLKGLIFLIIGIIIIQVNSVYGIINYYFFTEGKKYALKNYAKINEILNYERPYLGFFSAVNIIISFYFFSINKKKLLCIISSVFSTVLIIVISARLAFFIVLLIILIAIFTKIKKKNIITIVLSGIVFFLLINNSSLGYRFRKIANDSRVVIWRGASTLFFENTKYLFGSGGEENTRDSLLEHYKHFDEFKSKDEKNRFINKNYNTHNQYINELLRGGIIGLLLLVIPQAILLYSSFKRKNILGIMFLVSIFAFCLVENILDRQRGVYLYALFLSLINTPYKLKE